MRTFLPHLHHSKAAAVLPRRTSSFKAFLGRITKGSRRAARAGRLRWRMPVTRSEAAADPLAVDYLLRLLRRLLPILKCILPWLRFSDASRARSRHGNRW